MEVSDFTLPSLNMHEWLRKIRNLHLLTSRPMLYEQLSITLMLDVRPVHSLCSNKS